MTTSWPCFRSHRASTPSRGMPRARPKAYLFMLSLILANLQQLIMVVLVVVRLCALCSQIPWA